MTFHKIKATNEICQIADYIDGYTVIVYIVWSAKFGIRGTTSQPEYREVKIAELQQL